MDEEQAREQPIGARLTLEEQALIRSFQASDVRQRAPSSPTVAAKIVSDADLDYIPEEMKRSFLIETGEDLQDIGRMVLNFEQRPDDESAILSEMGRVAHKIKGTGSTLGFDVLAAVTLVFEDVIRVLQSGAAVARPEAVGTLTGLLALIESALEAAVADQTSPATLGELITHAEAMRDELLSNRDVQVDDPAETAPRQMLALHGQITPVPTGAETDSSSSRQRITDIESILRVDVHRLDELMTHVNALALNRASFIQMRDDILRLQDELDQALTRLHTVSQQVTDLNPQQSWLSSRDAATGTAGSTLSLTRPPHAAGDDLVAERFSEYDQALRQLTEVVADTTSASKYLRSALTRLDQIGDEQATITHDIQRDVMHIRLVHLEDLMPRIQLEARRLAASLGKAISFTTRGQMTQIDRNISEALAEPLIQLVRNAVVHGIESGDERVERGKSLTGNVWIHAYYVGSEVVIEVGDDGRGVNPHRLAASAVALGLVDAEAARRMEYSEALDMMFVPGITTFHEAQIVAGRGIGLDEVRTAIARLKGTIQVRSEPDKGSVFRIRVPISLSIVRALSVQVAGQPFAVPFSSVLQMVSVSQADLSPLPPAVATADAGGDPAHATLGLRLGIDGGVVASGRLEEQDQARHQQEAGRGTAGPTEVRYELVPALQLADLLGFESPIPATQLALILEIGRRRVALLVDQVSDDQEVVVQTLPSHLRRRSIRGTTVTPDGLVQLLLDLPELLQSAQSGGPPMPGPRRKPLPRAEASKAPRVLVVDDSMSIRGALELTLTRAGFDVLLARDGIEAFEMMRVATPRVVVLDIEMPRLDGFELLSVMRETPQFAEIRVVMLTSRAADKHREQALKLGASAYLIKPCPQETLIETVRAQLIDETSRR